LRVWVDLLGVRRSRRLSFDSLRRMGSAYSLLVRYLIEEMKKPSVTIDLRGEHCQSHFERDESVLEQAKR
jgi:hypothetical protein